MDSRVVGYGGVSISVMMYERSFRLSITQRRRIGELRKNVMVCFGMV